MKTIIQYIMSWFRTKKPATSITVKAGQTAILTTEVHGDTPTGVSVLWCEAKA